MISLRRLFAVPFCFCMAVSVCAEVPSGYYNDCEGKSSQSLLKALYSTITDHTNVGYDGLWEVYKTSDVYDDGTIWDIYSTKHWSTTSGKCGSYKAVGDCYNREHSFPKSWFGGKVNPMYADAFHLYPTDGRVNGQRSNYPYGECSNGTTLPSNGGVKALGKLGTSTFSGYSGTVFEPDDEYKGDLARSYFYMATCYNNRIASWSSEMLAGNSYPVFNTWSLNLLLKWHRQDPVSEKELTRNDAIYSHQKNRNPYIDHPELVEYIWGNKVGEAWHSTASAAPSILLPVNESSIDLGIGAVNVSSTVYVTVKGQNLTSPLNISIVGSGFDVSPKNISAEQANAGASVAVTCLSVTSGIISGTLELSSGDAYSKAYLVKTIENGLPLTDATDITPYSFNFGWVYVGDGDTYTLHLKQGNEYVPGYPADVPAAEERWQVTDLDPETAYTYYLTSATLVSRTMTVTTGALIPDIQLLFDGVLDFSAKPDEASDIAELLLEIENVSEDITITVTEPFQVSTDKSSWSQSVTLSPEEDRFYMRMSGHAVGNYTTVVDIVAGDYVNDDFEATGTIADAVDFIETFEETDPETFGSYSTMTFTGTACLWYVKTAILNPDSEDKKLNGSRALRMSKNSNDLLQMSEDKLSGLGTVSFEAKPYGSDADASVTVEYSIDGGTSWFEAGNVIVTGDNTNYSVPINQSGRGRIRFRQTSGKRWNIDNISITDYSSTDAVSELEYHSWDAYCRDGLLVIESRDKAVNASVYGIDGLTWFNGQVMPGERTLELQNGLYIVVVDDFARRVLVR